MRLRAMSSCGGGGDAWASAVTEREVERAVRRVNRRITGGVMSLPKQSQCLEKEWTRESARIDSGASSSQQGKSTLIFLHGFGDEGAYWQELMELLVRGIPGGCEVFLPSAPRRRFLISGEEKRVPAWFEPRMKQTRAETLPGAPSASEPWQVPWKCGGIGEAVAWTRALLAAQEARGAPPRSVVLGGFSQGAGLAMAEAASESGWSPVLGGVLCLRGYLPVLRDPRPHHSLAHLAAAPASPPPVLMCQGSADTVAPLEWATAATSQLRGQRQREARRRAAALRADAEAKGDAAAAAAVNAGRGGGGVGTARSEATHAGTSAGRGAASVLSADAAGADEEWGVELVVREGRGHDLAPADVWCVRRWLRARLHPSTADAHPTL